MAVVPKSVRLGVMCLMAVCGFVWGAALPAVRANASPPPLDIPQELSGWKSWVLYGMDEQRCPSHYDNADSFACRWPSRLKLTVDETAGGFEQQWLVFRDMWVSLPGSPDCYPEQVEIDGKAEPVIMRDRTPSVRLAKGEHHVRGVFSWKEAPETLMIPPESGIVTLAVNGRAVDQPVMDRSGRLWIRKRESGAVQENRLEIRVFRLFKDTIPMMAVNRFQMNISGQAREIRLQGLLLKNAVPLQVTSALPARLGPDGDVLIQARPGNWGMEIETRFAHPVEEIAAGACVYGEEIWSFEAQNSLRMVALSGAPAIDPGQTDVPPEWRQFPAFVIKPETILHFKTLRRGDSDPAPDRLQIARTWWLDFDGNGFTRKDRITGTLSRHWFLTMNPPGILGKVAVDGADQLITAHGPDGKAGVELRHGQLMLEADSRIDAPLRRLPVAGWDQGFQNASGVLNLPPGWTLFAASGVATSPASWLARWSLLDIFLVLITAIAVVRLETPGWGILALVTLALTYPQPGAPRTVWLSLLAATALVRVLPDGWIKKTAVLWRFASMAVLLTLAIPFSVQEIRQGIYPQLENIPHYAPPAGQPAVNLMTSPVQDELKPEMLRQKADAVYPAAPRKVMSEKSAGAGAAAQPPPALDPQALIQTGPGLPTWKWRTLNLSWNGPVDPDQTFRLWLIPPIGNLLLAFLRVLLLAVLTAGLCDFRYWRERMPFRSPAAVVVWLLFLGIMGQGPSARAETETLPAAYPPPALLEELQHRLLKKPDCFPFCADIPRMDIRMDAAELHLFLDVEAAAETAIPLPGDTDNWAPDTVLLDQQPLKGLMKDADGRMWALVPRGIHRLEIGGRTAHVHAIQIALPIKPRRVRADIAGWSVQGIGPDGRVSAGISLQRIEKQEPSEIPVGTSALSPFFHVERQLVFGLNWEVWTRIRRMTPPGAPVSLQIPLLAGESVTTAGIHVADGKAMINLDPATREIAWTSHLDIRDALQLKAPETVPWTETWILDAGPIWHCEYSGIPVIHRQDPQGKWQPEWRPWPGESVEIRISRPPAIPGPIVTIDSTALKWTPGERQDRAEWTVVIRTSRGGQHRLELPEKAVLQKVNIQGRSQPIRQEGRMVTVPLVPGTQKVELEWLQPASPLGWYHPPRVSIGAPAVNAFVSLNVPEHRWILWTMGPRLGPAVLFWGVLMVAVLIAIGLGRTHLTPLKTLQWLLLTIGLTQIHPVMALIIAGWLLILGVRSNAPPQSGWFVYNVTQLILAGWTAAALSGLYLAVEHGLLGIPDMQIAGNQSSNRILNWTLDRIDGMMPDVSMISLPEWVFHGLMLVWSLWLAFSLLGWIKWGWQCFSRGGAWKKAELKWRRKPAA